MLIDCSFFTSGARHILNASSDPTPNKQIIGADHYGNALEVKECIEGYIMDYQDEFLTKMLGYELGPVVNEYVCKFPYRKRDQKRPTRVEELEIEEYDSCLDDSPQWSPSMDILCEKLRESFADFIFYRILRDANAQSTITGLVRLKGANDYVSPIKRQVLTWNTMVERNRRFKKWAESAECSYKVHICDNMLRRINSFNL